MQERIPNITIVDGVSADTLRDLYALYDEWLNEKPDILVKTSGSTGAPKEIYLDKTKVRASAEATGRFFNFQKGQKALLALSTKHIAGKLMVVRALIHEMDLVVLPTNKNPLLNLSDNIHFDNNDLYFGAFVPYQVEAMLNDSKTRDLYESIEHVIIGGAPIKPTLEKEIRLLKNKNFATFGMTETITHFALKNLQKEAALFECLPGFEIDVDERGCLVIQSNIITDNLVTNDLVRLADHSRFEWLGRADFVINSAGYKISPEQVEAKLAKHLGDSEFILFGVDDEKWGERLVLFIEGTIDLGSSDWPAVWRFCGLEKYEIPKEIVFISELERTPSNKIIRKDYRS
ncbi:MAG: AMP-binding protein [Crocinitomicaceae bacterium]